MLGHDSEEGTDKTTCASSHTPERVINIRSTMGEWKVQLISNEHENEQFPHRVLSYRCDMPGPPPPPPLPLPTRDRVDGATRLIRNALTPARATSLWTWWHGSDGEAKEKIEFRKGIPRFLSSSCREAPTSVEREVKSPVRKGQSTREEHYNLEVGRYTIPVPSRSACAVHPVWHLKTMHTGRGCMFSS